MSDQLTQDQWPTAELTPAQQRNRQSAELIPVARSGVIPMNFAQMVDYAKFMSTAKGAVGAHLMGNVGGCLAVMEIANQFGLPAYAVARQSYLVNNRIAFMGQFFHSIIEDYAPLKKGPNGRKLQWKFEGDGDTLKIIVSATFEGASEPATYESPMWKDIKVKNSPLWQSEPKRQFVYFAVRGWQTINWSEGMMHAISEDEAAALPPSEYARDITPLTERPSAAILERLKDAQQDGPKEGFTEGFTESHFDVAVAAQETAETPPEPVKPKRKYTRKEKPEPADATPAPASAEPAPSSPVAPPESTAQAAIPTNATEWAFYCNLWLTEAEANPAIDAEAVKARWSAELKLRNDCGVTSESRDPIFERYLGIVDAKK
jgi:hypothetical protein